MSIDSSIRRNENMPDKNAHKTAVQGKYKEISSLEPSIGEIIGNSKDAIAELNKVAELLGIWDRVYGHIFDLAPANLHEDVLKEVDRVVYESKDVIVPETEEITETNRSEITTPAKSQISTVTHEELIARQKLLATPGGKTYRQPHADVLYKIVSLWSELSVPLQHRSRFYGGINGGLRNSQQYCLLELTRLNWLRAQQASKSEVWRPFYVRF